MSAELHIGSDCAPTGGLADALYFDSGERRLFGWLHRPSAGTMVDLGLVICKPFGYEAICSHRGLRAFAEAASALGVPTLRFDYSGTGDSAEIEPEADQLAVWSRDVVAAISELQRRTGVHRVCLLGFRLGALLATLAAGQCAAVNSLILVAPLISGRRYLRELRTTRLAASMGTVPAKSASDALTEIPAASAGSIEVSGFTFSAATLAALAQVDLTANGAPPVSDILVIDGSSFPAARGWAAQLSELGVPTKYLALPGLVEMIMTAPQFAVIPREMIAAMRDWLLQQLSGPSVQPENGAGRYLDSPPVPSPFAAMSLRDDGPPQQAPLTEHPVFLTSETVLFGIVTETRQCETRRRAVIMLNAGADHHIGPNGLYVGLARHWARRGYVVLRMDLAGLGDSGTRLGQPDNEVFPPAVLDDMRTAIEFLRGRYGVGDITLFGLCSGAYHALRAAAAGMPVNRILMVNPQNYFWKQGMTLNDLQMAEVVRNPGVYRQQVFSGSAWRRLLTGRVNIWRIVKIYLHRPLLALESTLRDLARYMHVPLPHDLGSELQEIDARGVRVVFVFARGEPGIDLLKIEGGSAVTRLGERCRVHIIDGADHIFSQSGPRAIMKKVLSDELSARAYPSAGRAELEGSH
jgi:alpha-beta hydrolase superfamily lysophospholipase